MTSRIRIAVVDDHSDFRGGVIQLLTGEPEFDVVGEGEFASDAISIVMARQPNLIILDVNMPGGGIEAARTIARIAPLTVVMMLTVVDDAVVVAEAEDAGAKCYILKGISGPNLTREIRRIWGFVNGGAIGSY